MGEESVKGANLGVILIIFAAILALGLIVFMLARNMANTGLTNVSERLQSAEESEFTDFDGTVVVGQRVHAALNGFKGKNVTVLIATQGFTDRLAPDMPGAGTTLPATWMNPEFNAKGGTNLFLDTAVFRRPITVAYAVNTDGHPLNTSTSSNVAKPLTFVQYNALLDSTNNIGNSAQGPKHADGHAIGNSVIRFDNGTYIFDGAYRTKDGRVVYDLDYANISRTGMTEMVPGAARFHANLLKDTNGVILGVVFQQVR